MTDDDLSHRVRLHDLKILADDHYVLRRADFDFQHNDGTWHRQQRESYDIGDAATVLPLDRQHGLVILIRQFRWPMFEWGYRQTLIETVAGKLDNDDPQTCIARETMEEAGVAIAHPRLVSSCFVSPGAVKERLWMFLADYDSQAPRQKGGGLKDEGEDIAVLESPLDDALAMIGTGEIVDLKTIALLHAAKQDA